MRGVEAKKEKERGVECREVLSPSCIRLARRGVRKKRKKGLTNCVAEQSGRFRPGGKGKGKCYRKPTLQQGNTFKICVGSSIKIKRFENKIRT